MALPFCVEITCVKTGGTIDTPALTYLKGAVMSAFNKLLVWRDNSERVLLSLEWDQNEVLCYNESESIAERRNLLGTIDGPGFGGSGFGHGVCTGCRGGCDDLFSCADRRLLQDYVSPAPLIDKFDNLPSAVQAMMSTTAFDDGLAQLQNYHIEVFPVACI